MQRYTWIWTDDTKLHCLNIHVIYDLETGILIRTQSKVVIIMAQQETYATIVFKFPYF